MGGFLSKRISFEGLSENDTVIVCATLISVLRLDVKPRSLSIIGPSGSGKSTVSIINSGESEAYLRLMKFINTAAGESGGELLRVGKGLEPCTKEVAHILCIPENEQSRIGRIVFVDTPPFPNPDERMRDAERAVERKIGDWLKKASVASIYSYVQNLTRLRFGKRIRVSGILYLYNSTDNRMTQPPAVHFDLFKNLLGNDFQGRVLLVMTMWERVKPDVRETRKKTLTRNWGYPASVVQHLGTKESAWDIIRNLLDDQNTR